MKFDDWILETVRCKVLMNHAEAKAKVMMTSRDYLNFAATLSPKRVAHLLNLIRKKADAETDIDILAEMTYEECAAKIHKITEEISNDN